MTMSKGIKRAKDHDDPQQASHKNRKFNHCFFTKGANLSGFLLSHSFVMPQADPGVAAEIEMAPEARLWMKKELGC